MYDLDELPFELENEEGAVVPTLLIVEVVTRKRFCVEKRDPHILFDIPVGIVVVVLAPRIKIISFG